MRQLPALLVITASVLSLFGCTKSGQDKSADVEEKSRQSRQDIRGEQKSADPITGNEPTEAKAKQDHPDINLENASACGTSNGIQVEILSLKRENVVGYRGGQGWDVGVCTIIEFKLTNTSDTKVVRFAGWHGIAELQDEHGNKFLPIEFPFAFEFPYGADNIAKNLPLHPGKSYKSFLYFEPMPNQSTEAKLTAPADALQGNGMLRFMVPNKENSSTRKKEGSKPKDKTVESKGGVLVVYLLRLDSPDQRLFRVGKDPKPVTLDEVLQRIDDYDKIEKQPITQVDIEAASPDYSVQAATLLELKLSQRGIKSTRPTMKEPSSKN